MPYEIQVKTIKKQRFSTLHDSIKPHDYPSDWNKPQDALFDQNMGGIKQTCGINQPCGLKSTELIVSSYNLFRIYFRNLHFPPNFRKYCKISKVGRIFKTQVFVHNSIHILM